MLKETALVLTGLLFAASCYSPYIKVSDAYEKNKPGRAWVESFLITLDPASIDSMGVTEKGLFAGGVKDAGTLIVEQFQQNPTLFGDMEPYFNKDLAEKLGTNSILGDQATAFLSGSWYHPESYQVPVNPVNIATGFQSVFNEFPEEFADAIMSVEVRILPVDALPPVSFFKTTQATIYVSVFARDGTKLFMSSARGKYGFSALVPDFRSKSIAGAFEKAMQSLKDVKVEKMGALDKIVMDEGEGYRPYAFARAAR